MKRITAKYPFKCSDCGNCFPVGSFLTLDGTTKLCDSCNAGKGNSPIPAKDLPKLATVRREDREWTIDWSDLKEIVRNIIATRQAPKGVTGENASAMLRNILDAYTGFHGFNLGQLERWLSEGYSAGYLTDLSEFIPPIREKRRFIFLEDGENFQYDRFLSGEDSCFADYTKREILPGMAIDAEISFSAGVKPEIVNAYMAWICRTVYSLETAGIDCELNAINRVSNLFRSPHDGTYVTRIRIKRENEATDFTAISPMLSPAGFRSFMFAAKGLHGHARGLQVKSGLGSPTGSGFNVAFSRDSGKLVISCDRSGGGSFPEAHMNLRLREALKDLMRG